MPKSSWASPKTMRRKCERGRGSVNVAAARANVIRRAMGARRGRLSAPWLQFHGAGRADVYNNTRTRVLLRRKCVKPRRPHHPFPAEGRRPSPHSDALPEHFLTPFPSTFAPPRSADAHPQAAPCIPRRRPSLAPSVPLRTQKKRHRTVDVRCIPRRPHNPFPAEDLLPPPHSDTPSPSTFAPPRSTDAPPPQRRPASPSVPLRAQKNGTAQWMCDAECLGRPSLRSVIGVDEPRAVRRRYGALAWRVGLRPQPWALRSRRCGRVLRA